MDTPNPFWVFFLGGRINDVINTTRANHFQLKFPNFQIAFSTYICWEALFNWSSDINIWGWRWRVTKYFSFTEFPNHGSFITKISKMDHFKQTEIKQNLRPPKNQYPMNKSCDTEFGLISVCIKGHITNL